MAIGFTMKCSEEMNCGTVQNLKWNVSGKDQRQGKELTKVEEGRKNMKKTERKGLKGMG